MAVAGGQRVGLIGAGGIARVHVDAWHHLGASVSVYSRSGAPGIVGTPGPGGSTVQAASSVAELIDTSDIVGILSPTPTHVDYALEALEAGTHVVCEKPLGRTVEEAVAIARAAQHSAGRLYPAHVVRFFPAYALARGQVRSGEIGEVVSQSFERTTTAPAAGSWFFDEEISGGILMDQLIHDLDQARWFAGEVTGIYAQQHPVGATGAPVAAAVTLTHASGALTQVRGFWGPPGTEFTTSFDILGEKGTIRSSTRIGTQGPDLEVYAEADTAYLPETGVAESPFTLQLEEFTHGFLTNTPVRVSVADGVIAVALSQAARESVRTGSRVTFSEAALRARL